MKTDQQIEGLRQRLFGELVWLNLTTEISQRIIEFPWKELNLMRKYKHFANVMFKNNFEYSVILIWKIYFDKSSDCSTFPRLKNQTYLTLTDKSKKELKSKLKPIEAELMKYKQVIDGLRNKFFAHKVDSMVTDYPLTFSQLKHIAELLSNYLNTVGYIAFNTQFVLVPYEYDKTLNKGVSTDIDLILNRIALESDQLRMKEDKPEMWSHLVSKWKKEGSLNKYLTPINFYRNKLGLSSID